MTRQIIRPQVMHLFTAGFLQVEFVLFGEKLFYGLAIHLVGNATIDRADRSTLRLFVEALAFGAFVGNDVVDVDADGRIALTGIDDGTVEKGKRTFNAATISDSPFYTAFIDSIIRALGFAGPAVDAFFCYINSHFCDN